MSLHLATRRRAPAAAIDAMLGIAGAWPATAQSGDETVSYTPGKGVLFKTQSGDFALRGGGLFTFDAGVFGPLSVQSEYSRVRIDRDTGANPTFHGRHLQAAYLLTGESRPSIVAKSHMFRGVISEPKPDNL